MTEQEWLKCEEPARMLEFLLGKISRRKLQLFTIACIRKEWHPGRDRRFWDRLEMAELFADGKATVTDLRGHWIIDQTLKVSMPESPELWATRVLYEVTEFGGREDGKVPEFTMIFKDLIGPLPFRPVTLNAKSLTPTVQCLALAIYDGRTFEKLPILADALEEAGCDQQDVLKYLRNGGEHVRGCWALDLVLGKS